MLALIVMKSDTLRDSLVTLLKTMPQIEAVACAQNAASALKIIDGHQPTFVVMDTNTIEEEKWRLLHELKRTWPQVVSLILADTVQHQERARGAGMHYVLLKGCPARRLSTTIEHLLLLAPNPLQGEESHGILGFRAASETPKYLLS